MQTAQVLPFVSLRTTRIQDNRNVIQAGLRGIQAYRSADFHHDYPEYPYLRLALRFSTSVQSAFYPWSAACILCTYQCEVGGGEGVGGVRRGLGRDFDRLLWLGVRAFELSCCPWGRDI